MTSLVSELNFDDANVLFETIEKTFPPTAAGKEAWFLVTLASLTGVAPEYAAGLYKYLISKPEYSASESRQALIRRLRETLVKIISVLGVCKPILALFSISKIECDEDKDYSFSREGWQAGPANREKGEKWLNELYKNNLSTATDQFAAHKDFDFISREITYGLYLSDHAILNPRETELVTLSGIMIQNLSMLTSWHLRATRRIGVGASDVELIQQCIEMVAKFGGITLHKSPRVADVEHEV